MNLYKKLSKHPYIFRQVTGVTIEHFTAILKKLRRLWRSKHLKKKEIAGRPYGVGELENHLVCLLMYYRTYATQLFIGFNFGVDDSTACRTIKRLEPFLAKVTKIKRAPKISQEQLETLLVDATEQSVMSSQREYYSGKKKRYTIKTEIIINKQGRIIQVSDPFPGRVHDITIRRQSKPIPKAKSIYADGGYRGLQHEEYPNIKLPMRKPRGKPHSKEALKHNAAMQVIRSRIERKFREMKIFKLMSHTYRNSKAKYAIKVGIIAGIVNIKNGF